MKRAFTMHFLALTIIPFATGIGPGVTQADENLLCNPAFNQEKHAPAGWNVGAGR